LFPALVALLLAGTSHPESLSTTRIVVGGARATAELRFQALSLLEVMPELDLVPDGELDAEECRAGEARIAQYLLAGLRLVRVDGEREEPLAGRLEALVPDDPAQVGALDLQRLDARLAFESSAPIEVLAVESRLFHETNPWHRDLTTLEWNGAQGVLHTFEGADTRWLFEPAHVRRPSVFATFVRLGIEHILGGYDHLAFLLALLVASRRLKSLVGVVTAFTLAHSITLAAAALGLVKLPPRFVELAIALSIAYVACENLLRREARNPWIEAFAFGLLHGLGFAGFLGEALTGEPLILTALVGFNLGVELGQLAVVLVTTVLIALAFRPWRRRVAGTAEAGLVPRAVRLGVSAIVALSGFYWFAERAGWL
jgi:hydrogenase/urease accessory protein HupE